MELFEVCWNWIFCMPNVAAVSRTEGVDPEAVAYEFKCWLMALYGWLAGLAEQVTSGSG